MPRPHKCPNCGSTNSTWKGHRNTLAGQVRLRRCRKCARKWTTKNYKTQEPQQNREATEHYQQPEHQEQPIEEEQSIDEEQPWQS